MSFTTINFAVFMAVVFLAYYLLPRKAQPYILLIASYIFYGFASIMGLYFLLGITVITYLGGYLIAGVNDKETVALSVPDLDKPQKKEIKSLYQSKRKTIVIWIVVLLVAIVVGFKYTNFLIGNFYGIARLFDSSVTFDSLSIILPVGLSFYTFQSMGYVIDVYRGTAEAEKNFLHYALFVGYFPQLLQGPLGDYNRLSAQLLAEHDYDSTQAKYGIQRVMWGVFKKLVIANSISYGVDTAISGYYLYSGLVWVIIIIGYGIQLYADFSGYMDIACGCSQMLGITLDENFDSPYFSKSIAEFWRRWHMSLGTWFKNYVFYPVLRSDRLNNIRKKYRKAGKNYLSATIPNVLALLVTWLLIGCWHGASWSYILYGLFHGFFVIMDSVMSPIYTGWRERHQKLSDSRFFNCFRVIRTFVIVNIGYCIFRPNSLTVTGYIYTHTFSEINKSDIVDFVYNYYYYIIAAGLGTIVLIFVDWYHYRHPEVGGIREHIATLSTAKRTIIYVLMVLTIIFLGAYGDASLSQFAYFQF